MKTLRRIMGRLLLGMLAAILAFYAAFIALMEASEREWLGRAPFHEAVDVRLHVPHQVALMDHGRDALVTRLRLIEEARTSIDLEIFIYELDAVSRMISQALARRAREGVKVRLLVDFAAPVFKLRPAYAQALEEAGVEVRYYNTAALSRFFSVQHRTHRKILAVDGRTAIIGGRNIANDYFDLADHYNFLDSDLLVSGPVVASIVGSFDLYWDSRWTASPAELDEEAEMVDLLTPRPADQALAAELAAQRPDHPVSRCDDIQFVTDYPGSGVEKRKVYSALVALAREAEREVLVETPYFVLRPDGAAAIDALLERGVSMTVLTNSLRSTDAYYTVAALVPTLDALALPGFQLWAYGGEAPPEHVAAASARWGVHAKRAVFDDATSVIGTYNVDPRSANLNSELILICRGNPALAGQMRESIRRRLAMSRHIVGGEGAGGVTALVAGADAITVVKMVLVMPVARMFDFLL